MSEILFQYNRVDPTTWVYLSSLLTIGLFFKFSRFWSVRNLDLMLLIALSPGLLMVLHGRANQGANGVPDAPQSQPGSTRPPGPAAPLSGEAGETAPAAAEAAADAVPLRQDPRRIEQMGYVCLFIVGGVVMLRLLCDPLMVRRPLLEPNMTVGGLIFTAVSLFAFLMANVLTGTPTAEDLVGPKQAERLVRGEANHVSADEALDRWGPGFPLLYILPHISTSTLMGESAGFAHEQREVGYIATARSMAILSHLTVVAGLIVIGQWHLQNFRTGISVATLYLLLPYTSQMTGRVDHALPAALLVWAIAAYRSPIIAGMFIGLAAGVIYYPAFLLPLWFSFYWQRGARRFALGVCVTLAILVVALALTSDSYATFFLKLKHMFGWRLPTMDPMGFWTIEYCDPAYRMTVLAAFVMICVGLAVWPAQKNLGTLMSCTAAVMLGTQFWHAHGGGLFMAWYLPLLLLTMFRTNLEDRIATAVVHNLSLQDKYAWLKRLPRAPSWRHRAAIVP